MGAKNSFARHAPRWTGMPVSAADRAPFMETKTFCSNCRVHCYRPDMREQIRQVMRFSGPRMLCCHPVMATRHVIETQREKRKLEGQHEV